jgi:hypothetical protein
MCEGDRSSCLVEICEELRYGHTVSWKELASCQSAANLSQVSRRLSVGGDQERFHLVVDVIANERCV